MSEMSRTTDHERRLRALEAHVDTLLSGRPGRKKKPIVQSTSGVCGVDPSRSDQYCPDASEYRRQQGCMGAACVRARTEYYREYRSK